MERKMTIFQYSVKKINFEYFFRTELLFSVARFSGLEILTLNRNDLSSIDFDSISKLTKSKLTDLNNNILLLTLSSNSCLTKTFSIIRK